MFSQIVCHYPFKQSEQQKLKLDLSIFKKIIIPQRKETEEEYYYFSESQLWIFIKSISDNNDYLDWSQVSSIFLGLGFRCKFSIEHIRILARFNTKFLQMSKQQIAHKHLNIQKDDEIVVQWFWQLFQMVASVAKIELVFEVLKILLDLNLKIGDQNLKIQKLGYYYLQLTKQQNDMFIYQNEIEKQSSIELMKKCFDNLEDVIKYCRSIFEIYKHSTIYGFRVKGQQESPKLQIKEEKQQNIDLSIQKEFNDKKENKSLQKNNQFDMLFQHAIYIEDRKRNQKYQKQLNEFKQNQNSPIKKLSISPSAAQISVSPVQQKKISRKQNKSVMDLKGTTEVIMRLEKAKQRKVSAERYWDEQLKHKNKQMKEFNLTVHKLPHPKPYIYIDVNIGIGKNQRIGLYNGDDLEEVAFNFGKAHSLNKNQIIGLQMRLQDIVSKFG